MSRGEDLERIRTALVRGAEILGRFSASRVGISYKASNSPVTDADLAVDETLRRELPRAGEGWLSEESPDDRARLLCRRVWIVDPLDGTREFLDGVPHWSVSIGLAEDGVAVAGGIYNPTTDELFLGAPGAGATRNGRPIAVSARSGLNGATIATNRWALRKRPRELEGHQLHAEVVNAMAYSLALVATGRADVLWSRSPKAEWDIAAGAAIIEAAGGRVTDYDSAPIRFNQWPPRAPGILASNGLLHRPARMFLATLPRPASRR